MIKLFISITVVGILTACHSNTKRNETSTQKDTTTIIDSHNSQNSLDWVGVYEGTIPCADCPGIKTTIKLNNNETFSYRGEYLERNTVVADSGKIMWHANGGVVHLKTKDLDTKYKVGENTLIQLDKNEKPLDIVNAESYNLVKIK